MPHLLVLTEWPYVEGALWGPVIQSPWSLELGALGMSLLWVVCDHLLYLALSCYWHIGGWGRPSCWLVARSVCDNSI